MPWQPVCKQTFTVDLNQGKNLEMVTIKRFSKWCLLGLPTFEVSNKGHFKGPRPDLGTGRGRTSQVLEPSQILSESVFRRPKSSFSVKILIFPYESA
jgi:hypothetical protein